MFQNNYHRELDAIASRTERLADVAYAMLTQALHSVRHGDVAEAQAVLAQDDIADTMTAMIESGTLDLISLQQPTRGDLRRMMAFLRTARDLERIADYACDIADAAVELNRPVPFNSTFDTLCQATLHLFDLMRRSMQTGDLDVAQAMDHADDAVDRGYSAAREELLLRAQTAPDDARAINDLQLVARYLERIGDHVVNVAEMMVFERDGALPVHHGDPDLLASGGLL